MKIANWPDRFNFFMDRWSAFCRVRGGWLEIPPYDSTEFGRFKTWAAANPLQSTASCGRCGLPILQGPETSRWFHVDLSGYGGTRGCGTALRDRDMPDDGVERHHKASPS